MPNDPKNTDPGVSTNGDTPPAKIEVDSAELETLKQSKGVMDDLNTEAVDLGFRDFDEYKQFLEEKKYNEITTDTPPADKPAPPVTPTTPAIPVVPAVPAIPAGDNGADKKLFQQSAQLSGQAWLESQYAQYRVDQLELPKEERSSMKKTELFKLVTGLSGKAIESLSREKEFDGNLFAAADVYANMKDFREKARKAGAESQLALNKAGETANLPGGVVPPQPASGKSPEDINDELADLIIPDDPPIE